MPGHPQAMREKPEIDIREFGAPKEGKAQILDRRMFFQLQVFTGCFDASEAKQALEASGLESVLYQDVNDARGVALLFMNEDPSLFVESVRDLLLKEPFKQLTPRPEMSMIGRTYSIGREPDLEEALLERPRRNALNPDSRWAVWYPLRRRPDFALLSREEQGRILGEHALIGRTYGMADLAHDVRLACHGLDQNDNEFVIGLLGKELYPLSRVVQDMRRTQQTAKYIQSLGPFFVGKVIWQSPKHH